ncbi:hypothetical protein Y032_0213g2278 [Ancylostoma ceylanicum]|uniref:ShKT domain-containing protein n=1 Tax=Ancylostoma ceylanicum TaxID=53326 RepID=A0A016SKI1_9BILA|nr:hypothetical protein Y032_0213g2278 [Ancylostoma ceylanicum]
MRTILIFLASVTVEILGQDIVEECRDLDSNCRDWVAASARSCEATDYIMRSCKKSCGFCGPPEKKLFVFHGEVRCARRNNTETRKLV